MKRALTNTDQSAHALLGLELMRFACAVSVLLWHYQHFFFQGGAPVGFETSAQPLYTWLKPFYEAGWLGVQSFWALSGFIFFWKYAQPVAQGRVSTRRFAVLRFSRLYPLHLLTLLIVAALGLWYRQLHGSDYVYQYNDWTHFALQLFMASDWPGRSEWSFNGPIWSISIEVLVYALFFALCKLGLTRWWQVLGLIGASGMVYALKLTDHPIVLCVFFFYLGALTHLAHEALVKRPRWLQYAVQAAGLLAVTMGTALLINGKLRAMFYVAVLTPVALIVLLDWVQPRSATAIRWINRLGNTTYASYLLHFPLQLLLACLTSSLGFTLPLHEPAWVLAYLIGVFGLATVVYQLVEMPAQSWLRQRLGTH
ncbi:MAG TPA: acyltransferase [Aquabacterium sp.]|uniref:acyltransferase family protein n=1 Tax=Aquabacterium sp. TaxID=1872578 RepID=UPI002E35CD3C|nr:acyltransferase [Aquabacterium sp.]HEX5357796.1 acyltransferase [Aquabacterium sp.]